MSTPYTYYLFQSPLPLFIIKLMSTREAKKTKETLQKHKQDFKNVLSEAETMQQELKSRIYEEITRLDEEDKKQMARFNNRKKMLALKSSIEAPYVQQQKELLEVPVDGDLKAGTMVFMKNCATCHSLQPIDPKPTKAPSLGLIYNRKAGSNPSFTTYGLDLLKANFYWTPKNLYDFMGNTSLLLPKTSCRLSVQPLKNEADRADLLALFKEFTSEMIFNMRLKEVNKGGYDRYQTNLHTMKEERERGKMREESDRNRERKI